MHLVREGAVLAPSSLWVHHTLFSGPAHPVTNVAIETRFGYRLPPTFHFGSSHCSEKESRRIALDLSTRPTMYHSLLLRQRSVRAPWPCRRVLIIQKCFFLKIGFLESRWFYNWKREEYQFTLTCRWELGRQRARASSKLEPSTAEEQLPRDAFMCPG